MRAWVICLLCLVVGCNSSTSGTRNTENDTPPSSSAPPLVDWPRQYEEMCELLSLDETTAEDLRTKMEHHAAILEQWHSESGARLADLESKMMQAARDKELGEFNRYRSQAKKLKDRIVNLNERRDRAIEQALPDDSRWAWYAHRNVARLTRNIESLKLTPPQNERLKKLSLQTVTANRTKRAPEQAGYGDLMTTLGKSGILTPEQRIEFERLIKKRPLSFIFR